MQFDISYDFKQPVKFLSALEKRLSRKRDLLNELGRRVVSHVMFYIYKGVTPEGNIAETGEIVAELEGKPDRHGLIWTGALVKSIKHVLSGDAAYVGSPLPYAEKVRVGGQRTFRRKVYNTFGEERWIPGGIVYENGVRSGKAGSIDTGTGVQKGYWKEYTMETEPRNYLVVTQEDADDLMEYLWESVING